MLVTQPRHKCLNYYVYTFYDTYIFFEAILGTNLSNCFPCQVRVNNYGLAMHSAHAKTDRSLIIVPTINSISPTGGSTEGGQTITITGSDLCFGCGSDDCSNSRRRRSVLSDFVSLDGGSTEHSAVAVGVCENIVSSCKF